MSIAIAVLVKIILPLAVPALTVRGHGLGLSWNEFIYALAGSFRPRR